VASILFGRNNSHGKECTTSANIRACVFGDSARHFVRFADNACTLSAQLAKTTLYVQDIAALYVPHFTSLVVEKIFCPALASSMHSEAVPAKLRKDTLL
jgi:hypothetical protein